MMYEGLMQTILSPQKDIENYFLRPGLFDLASISQPS